MKVLLNTSGFAKATDGLRVARSGQTRQYLEAMPDDQVSGG